MRKEQRSSATKGYYIPHLKDKGQGFWASPTYERLDCRNALSRAPNLALSLAQNKEAVSIVPMFKSRSSAICSSGIVRSRTLRKTYIILGFSYFRKGLEGRLTGSPRDKNLSERF